MGSGPAAAQIRPTCCAADAGPPPPQAPPVPPEQHLLSRRRAASFRLPSTRPHHLRLRRRAVAGSTLRRHRQPSMPPTAVRHHRHRQPAQPPARQPQRRQCADSRVAVPIPCPTGLATCDPARAPLVQPSRPHRPAAGSTHIVPRLAGLPSRHSAR